MFTKFVDGVGEFGDAAVFGGDRAKDGWMPAIARHHQREHGVQLLFEAVAPSRSDLFRHENVADFHQAGFHVLDVVAQAGDQNHDAQSARRTISISSWPTPTVSMST